MYKHTLYSRTFYVESQSATTREALIYYHGGGQGDPNIGLTQANLAYFLGKNLTVVLPQGTPAINGIENGRTWNAKICCGWAKDNNINELNFYNDLLSFLQTTHKINKVYLCGISNGSILIHELALNHNHQVKLGGIGCVAGGLGIDPNIVLNSTYKPCPVIMFHGGMDTHYPYMGGTGRDSINQVDFYSIDNTIKAWKKTNRSKSDAQVTSGAEYICHDYKKTFSFFGTSYPTKLYFLPGGGHTWPGGKDFGNNGPVVNFNANEAMWNFWKSI